MSKKTKKKTDDEILYSGPGHQSTGSKSALIRALQDASLKRDTSDKQGRYKLSGEPAKVVGTLLGARSSMRWEHEEADDWGKFAKFRKQESEKLDRDAKERQKKAAPKSKK